MMAFRYSSQDFKSPKKLRYDLTEGREDASGEQQHASKVSEATDSRQQQGQRVQQSPNATEQPCEAGGSNEAALGGGTGPPAGEPAVTDATKAFRQLRVRPALSSMDRVRAGSPARTPAAPDRPSSPKKRKASYNIDKEFILKDDKVKRNTDTQGDISQARGQLGQLLFEFSQIELNRDLIEAIKRTESKTGRTLVAAGRPSVPGRLNRAAFEVAVGEAAELLQEQLRNVEAHCGDSQLRSAILRTYAVQAIATFADEDWDSEEEEEGEEDVDAGVANSSDEENNDSNSQRLRGGSCSLEGVQGQGDGSGSGGSQHSQDMLPPRPSSAAGCHSPRHMQSSHAEPNRQQSRSGRQVVDQGAASGGGGNVGASPQRIQAAGSYAEQASSSFLPDAPPDSALEDTATASLREEALQQGQAEGDINHDAGQPESARLPAAERQPSHQQQGGVRPQVAGNGRADDGHMQQRMRMLSLETEGSEPLQQGSSAGDGEEEDGPTDMIRSPAPVTSRRTAPPLPPTDEREEDERAGRGAAGAAGVWRQVVVGGDSSRHGSPSPVLEEARRLELGANRSQQQQQQQQQQGRQQQQEQQQSARRGEQAQQEGSEGQSQGRASSAAAEPPKRQRRSGDDLPPPQEHSPPSAPGVGGAAAPAAGQHRPTDGGTVDVTAAQRALILGSLQHPRQRRQQAGSPTDPPPPDSNHDPAPHASSGEPGQQQAEAAAEASAADGGEGLPSDATLRALRPAHSGSSVWGSTLVCADLTVNDVASKYWPFLRSAMQGQAVQLQARDKELVASLVQMLGDTVTGAYMAEAGGGRRPAAEVKSLVAATAFDDFFRAKVAADSSGASL